MLDERRYEFAADTLKGIASTIRERQHATEGQLRAVTNIANARR